MLLLFFKLHQLDISDFIVACKQQRHGSVYAPTSNGIHCLKSFSCTDFHILLDLIWVQTVCNGYQQRTKVDTSKERVKSTSTTCMHIFITKLTTALYQSVVGREEHVICAGFKVKTPLLHSIEVRLSILTYYGTYGLRYSDQQSNFYYRGLLIGITCIKLILSLIFILVQCSLFIMYLIWVLQRHVVAPIFLQWNGHFPVIPLLNCPFITIPL